MPISCFPTYTLTQLYKFPTVALRKHTQNILNSHQDEDNTQILQDT